MIAGISSGVRNGAVALADRGRLVGVCSQERVTRVKGAGVNANGLPDEAIDVLLERLGRARRDISRYVVADAGSAAGLAAPSFEHIDRRFAHASTAYLTSRLPAAGIVVCDHEPPFVGLYSAEGANIRPLECPPFAIGFTGLYSRFSAAFGLSDQQFEALARLRPGHRDAEVDRWVTRVDGTLRVDPALPSRIEGRLAAAPLLGDKSRSALAAALQARLADLLVDFLRESAPRFGSPDVCLGGSLFYHSSINSAVTQSGVFRHVSVPVDPGASGLAVGAACHGVGSGPAPASPFLGPSYSAQEIKETLDNCKLQYTWAPEGATIESAVEALKLNYLVGWFDGPMEWGHRALGARCILANPTAPYALENLNHFLKRREAWRGYALSGLQEAMADHFDGPDAAPFMEYDYRVRDARKFRHVLPDEGAAIRVQTVDANSGAPRFRRLLEAFGDATGLPFLVNTSFNGFHEPIVCSPRDAVRVFYGTGLDVLICDQFVLRK